MIGAFDAVKYDRISTMKLSENPKAHAIMGCARRVHGVLGRGFLESAYGDALEIEFKKAGIPHVREDAVRIFYGDQVLPTRYRADFTCFNGEFIVELKALKTLANVERAQVVHRIRATRVPFALLINFGRETLQYDTCERDKMLSASFGVKFRNPLYNSRLAARWRE